MHLGNSIICPVTGIPMLVVAGAFAFYSVKNIRKSEENKNILFRIIMTAFVFSMQMINFSIPPTDSSGHIIGAILLAILFGKNRAFISMCVILTVQALLFNDGGLLALGCNIFNMGVLPCFVAYPLIYKTVSNKYAAPVLSCIGALLLGSIAVVLETVLSGTISSNIANFLALMTGIHVVIGLIEGIISASVIAIIDKFGLNNKLNIVFSSIIALLCTIIFQYASTKPDGLEWALLNISESITLQTQGNIYELAQNIQSLTSVFLNMNPVVANVIGIFALLAIMLIINKVIKVKSI